MPVDLPSGTVTFLFTDIEDSTRRWEEQPAAMGIALARHDELLRRAVAAGGGVVFSHAGDGMAAAFGRGGDAIEAAVAAQRAFESEPWPLELRVRMAVHTGEAEERDGDYFGPALNRAGRLMGLATGGQVLVSLAAAEVVRDRLPAGLGLTELGERALRSLSRPERVFELTWSADSPSTGVEVRVLGPLRLIVAGADVAVPGSKRRALLALLAMASPGPISVDSLVLAMWPDEPTASGAAALQSHVSRLRRHLGAAASRLEIVAGGYRLRLEPGELDAGEATALLDRARQRALDDAAAGLDIVREARRLWQGPTLEEFADVDALAGWRQSLEEQRLAAADLHAQLALATGGFQEAVEVAGSVVAEDGLRESSVLLLMQALAGSGRAAEALRAGHAYRQRLAEQVGLQPSAALSALEQTIAGADEPSPELARRPPSRSAAAPRATLIGRDAELAGIARLSQSECLVTLVGPGGVGKTSLALEMARRDRTGRDVTVVTLAPISDGAALVDVLAAALGLRGAIGDPLVAASELLESRPWLVVLDNCEHLLTAVRQLVATLVDNCRDLTIVATSRERLGLPFEQICRVAPLPLPARDQRDGIESVPSVAVFLDRAKRVQSAFEPSAADVAAIATMVRRLDGMPLAIQLAAGRLSSLSLRDLGARLDRALDVLGGGTEGDERHSTLRAAVEWSYNLLSPDEQRLFRALAVFPDGFDLSAAEAVAGDVAPAVDPTAAVAHLVDASMLEATFAGTPRYRMLETLRSFGLDRLGAYDELDAATARFLRWATTFADWVDRTITTPDEPYANERLLAEFGNLRAAWHIARSNDDLDVMAALVVSLYWTGSMRGLVELLNWMIELAADPRLVHHRHAAPVFGAASNATWLSGGDRTGARALAQRGLDLVGDHDSPARRLCLVAMADVEFFDGRCEEAAALYLEAAEGSPWRDALVGNAALGIAYAGRLDEGRVLHGEPTVAASPTTRAWHHYVVAEMDNLDGAWTSAQQHYREALELSELSGTTFLHGVAAVGLVSVQAAAGETEAALRGYGELIDYWERTGGWTQQWTTLRNLADLLDRLDDHDTASLLRAAADEAPEAARVALADTPRADAFATPTRRREEVLTVAREALARHLEARA